MSIILERFNILTSAIAHAGTNTSDQLEYRIFYEPLVGDTPSTPSGTSFFASDWK